MFRIAVQGAKTLSQVSRRAGAAGHDTWMRADTVPPSGIRVCLETMGRSSSDITRWFVCGRQSLVSFQVDPSNPKIIQLQPNRFVGDRIDIRCRIGSQEFHHRLWCITGEVCVRDRGPISSQSSNSARRHLVRDLVGNRAAPNLGFDTFPDTNGHTQYWALVEIVGTVRPWDVPIPFHMVRRVITSQVTSGLPQKEAMEDDTNEDSLQDQTLSPAGRIYDLDAPGSHFESTDPLGTRHDWSVRFEQLIAIGELQSGRGWYTAEQERLAISPPRRWGIDYSAEVVRAGRHPQVRGTVRHIGDII